MNQRSSTLAVRAGTLALAGESALIAAHALPFPEAFYDSFLLGRGWVRMLPPYNEHLTRDLGALYLGFAVVLAHASRKGTRDVVTGAVLGFVVATVPHLLFHATHLEDAPLLLDKVLQSGLLAVTVAVGAVVLFLVRRDAVPAVDQPAVSAAQQAEPAR